MTQPYLCPDCKDTGVYRGLNTVEPCRACGGRKPTGETLFGIPIIEVAGMETPQIIYGNASFSTLRENKPKSVTLSGEQLREIAKKNPPPEWWYEGEPSGQPISHEIQEQATECPKPFDEITPAELEGLKEGDSVAVEIHCENWQQIFDAIDRFIDRPLFGKPANSFRLKTVHVGTPIPGSDWPPITGELLYKPRSDADKFGIIRDSNNEIVWWRWIYASNTCQDMLFVPIVED